VFHTVEDLDRAFAGRYVIERELGRGGMATVYLARDLRHGRRVAIKVFQPEYAAGVTEERFRAEIEIAAALAHPGIVPVFDSGAADDVLYYVMPFIEGESLRALLTRQPRLSVDQVLRIARDVGDALAYAHAHGIVHRDIKPENILLVSSRAVVADFGIARALDTSRTSKRLTVQGVSIGTPLYMSPEQANGETDIDGRSDLHSLASVVYEMLGGAAPHIAATPVDVVLRKLAPVSDVAALARSDVSPTMEAAIRRALAVTPSERFATTTDFVEALGGTEITLAPTVTINVTRRRGRRRPALMALAGLVTVVLLAIGLAMWRRFFPPLTASDGRIGVAVLPFRPTTTSAAQWAEAVPDLLTTALDGTPGIRVVDPWALWRTLRTAPTAAPSAPDPNEAERLAERAGVGCYLLGTITQLEDHLTITVRLYRRGRGDPWQTFRATSTPDSLSAAVQRLAIDLIRQLSSSEPSHSLASFDRGLTRSPDALKAWLSAREFRRRGIMDSADVAITKAISLDSTFAFALIDAASIRTWLQFGQGRMFSDLMPLAERAVRLSDSLPPRQRLRAVAMLASIRTEGLKAADALERIIAIDDADVQAWSMLSYIDTEYGWQFGRGEREARVAEDRALQLDSTDATVISRLTWLAIAMNDSGRLDELRRRHRQLDTSSSIVRGDLRSIEAVRATDAQFASLLDRMSGAPIVEWISLMRTLRFYRPDRADMLAQRLQAMPAMPSQRTGLTLMVQLLAAESRWNALDSLRRTGAFSQIAGFDRLVNRLIAAAAIAGVTDEATGQRAVEALAAALPPDSARAWLPTHDSVWLEGWLIGAWHAMYGDTVLAGRWLTALGTLPKGGSPPEYGSALKEDVAARLAARHGDRQTALTHASRALELWTIHTGNTLELMPEPAMRFQVGSLLRATGRADSAAVLFRSLVPPSTWLSFYTARSALELGEISSARGDRAYADRQFLTALRLWERGDSIVASLRDRARRGLAHDRS
jgi:tRNA A-37 threonylcarbamoyl transferase component Bud32